MGLGLFLMPFVVVVLAMTGMLVASGLAPLAVIPVSFLLAVLGMLVLAAARAREARGLGRGDRRGMRGDSPGATSVDFPDPPPAPDAGRADAPRDQRVRCRHCAVWSPAGTARCPHCGAALG